MDFLDKKKLKNLRIFDKTRAIYSKFILFLVPKFLELFFTPENTPPKPKNSKLDKSPILFGTPCSYLKFET